MLCKTYQMNEHVKIQAIATVWSVCLLGTPVSSTKIAKQIEILLGGRLVWDHETIIRRRCTLAPSGEYNGSICAAAAMQPVTTITEAMC